MKVAEWVANFSYSQIYLKDISTISIILIVASLVIYKMKFKNNIVTKNLLVSFFLILSVICFIPNICTKMIFLMLDREIVLYFVQVKEQIYLLIQANTLILHV